MLRAHLWREWREFRAVLLAMAGLVPGLVILCVLLMPDWADSDSFVSVTVGGWAFVAVFVMGGYVVPKEMRGDSMHLLRRLPSGLGPVFCAKVLFIMCVLVGVTALALVSAIGAQPGRALKFQRARSPGCCRR